MSFYAEEKRKARCPLFLRVVRCDDPPVYGVNCCEFYSENDKRGSSFILRFEDMESALNRKRIFCDNALAYPMCKLYRVRQSFPEEMKETS